MKLQFHTNRVIFNWQILDSEFSDPEGRIIFALYVKFGKWSRGWILRLSGDLNWATVRYDIIFNDKRTGWMVQSPVRRVY